MINGYPQGPNGLIVPNGSIKFQLNVDATVIAAPHGFVAADIPVVFQFNAAGQIQPNPPAVAAQLWSNEELQPQLSSTLLGTYYLVTFYDQNGAVLNATPLWWQFPETAGSTVDISQMTPVSTVGGNIIYYPTSIGGSGTVTSVAFVGDGTILSATPSTPVTIAGNLIATLLSQNAHLVFAGPTTGSAAAPTFRALVAADIPLAAGGTNTDVQFNNSGALGGSALFTWDDTLHQLTVSSGATVGLNLANATAATSGANQSSPIFQISGQYWTGSVTGRDTWTIQDILGTGANPVSTLTLAHTGSSGGVNGAIFSVPQLLGTGGAAFATSITAFGAAAFAFSTGNSTEVLPVLSVATSVGATATYSATIIAGGAPLAGQYVTIAGFTVNPSNNGRFIVSSATPGSPGTLVVFNSFAVAETHAATATVDSPFIPQAGYDAAFGQIFGSPILFPILGTNYIAQAGFEAIPSTPNITLQVKGNATDAAYFRILNNGATGDHGLEIGSIIDGTGASPVILRLGQFNGAPSAVLSTKFTQYGGVFLAGNGFPSEPFQIVATVQVANYNAGSAKTIFTPATATILRVVATEAPGVTATGATLPSLTLGWTDVAGVARTLTLLASTSTSASTTYVTATTDIYTNNSTPVTVTSAAYAAGGGTALSYYLVVTVEIL